MIEAVKVRPAKNAGRQMMPGICRRSARNRSSGQALAEGAVALWLLATAFVLLIAMGINLFFVTQRLAQANLAATQAAKVIAVNKYWLCAVRPDWDTTKPTAET